MKPIQKYITIVILFIIITGIVTYLHSSQLDESLHTNINSHINTDTNNIPESSPTFSGDTNIWGGNPFKIGATITGEGNKFESLRLEFKKPNTEWKTRTLSGITYVFGEGNPKEVAPKLSEYSDSQEYFHDITIRSKTEKFLKDFLENPMLITVINKCGSLIQPDRYSSVSLEREFPGSLYSTDFSLSKILLIDFTTGRKKIDWDRLGVLGSMLYQIRNVTSIVTGERENLLAKQCLLHTEIVAFDSLMNQYGAIGNSAMNDSLENHEEVMGVLNGN